MTHIVVNPDNGGLRFPELDWAYTLSILSRACEVSTENIWVSARQNLQYDLYDQQRLRSACTSTQYGKGSR